MSALSALIPQERLPGGRLAVVGGALIALGAILPWVTVHTDYGGVLSESGMVGGDGALVLGVGILVAILGVWVILGHPRVAPVLLVVAGVTVIGLTAREFYLGGIQERVENTFGFEWAVVGTGIYTLFAGGLAAALAGVMAQHGKTGRGPATLVLVFLLGLAVLAVLTTFVVIAFFSTSKAAST